MQLLFVAFLMVYVASYVWLSRRGYAEADQWNMKGFYYFTPEDTDAWRTKNYTVAAIYEPINWLDCSLGTGRSPACEPMWRLEL
jgi:hypothetical protein